MQGQRQRALQARQVKILIERLRNQHGIKIGRHGLGHAPRRGIAARKAAAARQGAHNGAVARLLPVKQHKIAHGGERLAAVVVRAAAQGGKARARIAHNLIAAAMLAHNARGQAGGVVVGVGIPII